MISMMRNTNAKSTKPETRSLDAVLDPLVDVEMETLARMVPEFERDLRMVESSRMQMVARILLEVILMAMRMEE